MYAAMAQLVEHILGKDEVPGPNPGSSSRQPRRETFGALAFYRGFAVLQKGYFFILGLSGAATPFVPGFVALPQIRSAYPDRRSKSLLFRRRERVSSPWRIPGCSRGNTLGLWLFIGDLQYSKRGTFLFGVVWSCYPAPFRRWTRHSFGTSLVRKSPPDSSRSESLCAAKIWTLKSRGTGKV